MFYVTTDNPLFRFCGLAILLLQLCLFIWALPPFQMGIWLQTEPIVFALLASAALGSIWLGLGIARKWITVLQPAHPIWLCLFAWVGWQLLASVSATSPWRSWFGPPQTGDGAALSVVMLLMVIQSCALWQISQFRRIIMATAAMAMIVQTGLHAVYQPVPDNVFVPDRWAPAQWPEYLPFMAGYLWITFFAGGFITSIRRYILLFAGMVIVLFISWNESAIAPFTLAMIATTIIGWCPLPSSLRRLCDHIHGWRLACIAACLLPMAMVLIAEILPTDNSSEHSGIIKKLTTKDEGIGSRMVLNQVAVSTLSHEPSRWLIGDGWGRFGDDLFKYALVDGVHVFHEGKREPNWFLVDGSAYHVHNQPLEALLSLGLPGMLLWYALPILLVWYMPRKLFWQCAPMLVALTALGHLWMQLAQCIPYQALFLASMLVLCTNGHHTGRERTRLQAAVCAVIALVLAWTACGHWSAMRWGDTLQHALRDGSHKDYSEEWLAEDFKRGGDRWTASAAFYSRNASMAAAAQQADENTLGWYSHFLNTAHIAAADPSIGARASAMQLRLQYYLFGGFDDSLFSNLRHDTAKTFESAVMRFIHKAPSRDDYTSFFLINLAGYTEDNLERQRKILTRMLLIAPDHRGALWLLGYILTGTQERAEDGKDMMQRAADLHVEDVFPITSSDLKPFREAE